MYKSKPKELKKELIHTFKEFTVSEPATSRIRNLFRNTVLFGLSLRKSMDASTNWIRFPYYHHVFEDERADFERQLNYLRNFGEFISLDEVCSMLHTGQPINGRYFCVSFDDGYRCLYHNMMPITAAQDIPVMIYVPTDYIGLNENKEEDLVLIENNLPGNPKLLSFLNWEQCREMIAHKVSFGSHTKTHAHLAKLNNEAVEYEMRESKQIIEQELQQPCLHFACPWGRIHIDFDPSITTPVAKALGYRSFVTTNRGKTVHGSDPYLLPRDHVLAGWSNYQLRYFFGE